jgi:ribosome assembly protein YihI (activator of Der GTPase)
MTADYARMSSNVKLIGPQKLEVSFPPKSTLAKENLEKPERRKQLEQALAGIVGSPVKVELIVTKESATASGQAPAPKLTRQQRMKQIQENPLVKQVIELFDGEIVR